MHEEIRAAFDSVHAEPELKAAARAAVARRARRQRSPARPVRLALATAACAAVVVLGGGWLYLTPTAHISIDVNPSLELGINWFDRVISVQGWNDDGTALAETLDVKNLTYTQAVETILQSETITALVEQDAVVEIGVIGDDDTRCAQMLAGVESCAEAHQNTHCYQAGTREVEEAHECGLSYGKYRVYRELAALDPTVTPEEVQGMTMREIRDRIAALSGGAATAESAAEPAADSAPAQDCGNTPQGQQQKGPGHHGAGHHEE